jgi:hypothetical protein
MPSRGVGTQLANFMLAQVQMCFVCVAQLSNKNHATISKVTASAADLYLGVMRPLSAAEVREINASFPWSVVAMFQVRSECAAPESLQLQRTRRECLTLCRRTLCCASPTGTTPAPWSPRLSRRAGALGWRLPT